MLKKRHNETTREFFQKILIFIETTMINSASTAPDDVDKLLVKSLFSVKDAIFAELVRDSQVGELNDILQQQENKKTLKKTELKKSSLETK